MQVSGKACGVGCTGSEGDLLACRYTESGTETCNHAGVICQPPIRLSDGYLVEGQVEVWYNNQWGNVCDDNWSKNDAMVVCRQLGLPYDNVLAKANLHRGSSSSQNWMKDVNCKGTEDNLWSCEHRGGQSQSWRCDNYRYAVAVCQDIRLVNGSSRYDGRVEVWHKGQWGTVCDRDWDVDDAKVVCRQLDMSHENALVKTGAYFGKRSGPIWLDKVNCTGSEQNLILCEHSDWGVADCGQDAGVVCESPIRLVNGSGTHEGRVEVWHTGHWGTVCDTSFGRYEGEVVCRELGLPYENPVVKYNAFFGKRTGPIWLDELDCQGHEDSLLLCKHRGWGLVSSGCSDGTGVRCERPIRLVNGRNIYEGRVEVWYNGLWGTVCDAGWDYNNVKVVCRQLGLSYDNAELKTGAYFGEGTGNIWLNDFVCTGSEENLWTCEQVGRGAKNCNHRSDVGVVCQSPIRIVDGDTKYEGRVEIWNNDQWGSICSNNWDDAAARVVCQQMGFPGARQAEIFGTSTEQVWLDIVECTGDEERLLSCRNNGWRMGNCSDDIAGVTCQAPIRLVDRLVNVNYQGRVEVWHNGEWGTVCGGYDWDDNDAQVVCRQLGLSYEYVKAWDSSNRFGEGSGQIWLSNVGCAGSEENIWSCDHLEGGYCSHYDDVGVECRSLSSFVRLTGGDNDHEGRVEILPSDRWGTVCDEGWGNRDAKVVCRQMGLPFANAKAKVGLYERSWNDDVMMYKVKCTGSEGNLLSCPYTKHGYCETGIAGVVCK